MRKIAGRFVAGLSPQRAEFDLEPDFVWFILDKVSLALSLGILTL